VHGGAHIVVERLREEDHAVLREVEVDLDEHERHDGDAECRESEPLHG